MAKEPIFEVREHTTGKIYRIWANGETEGFEGNCLVINRVTMLCHAIEALTLETARATLPADCRALGRGLRETVSRMAQPLKAFWRMPTLPAKSKT